MVPKPEKPSAINDLHYKYHILMNGFYNKIFVMQSEVYVINDVNTEHIELQVTWRSVTTETLQTYVKHISVIKDYNQLLQETYEMCKNIIKDAKTFGEAPYWEVLRNL